MTSTLNFWTAIMDRYQDEGEWMNPCSPVESGLLTALAGAIFLAPFLAFLYFVWLP